MSCLGITKLQGSDNPLKFKLTVIELTEIKEVLHQEKTLIKKTRFLCKMQTSMTAAQHGTGINIVRGKRKQILGYNLQTNERNTDRLHSGGNSVLQN